MCCCVVVGLVALHIAAVVRAFFFFNDTATTEIYTLSLHDALPICRRSRSLSESKIAEASLCASKWISVTGSSRSRSEEHTSELQSRQYLVCRLLLEKKKKPEIIFGQTTDKLIDNTALVARFHPQ